MQWERVPEVWDGLPDEDVSEGLLLHLQQPSGMEILLWKINSYLNSMSTLGCQVNQFNSIQFSSRHYYV